VSAEEAVRAFGSLGWEVDRQRSTHIAMGKPGEWVTLSIPNHKEIARGSLRKLIRLAGLTVGEFVQALERL
jgi:predicted RNA binding protein YcfA (HicA-like mRNA interferase family)